MVGDDHMTLTKEVGWGHRVALVIPATSTVVLCGWMETFSAWISHVVLSSKAISWKARPYFPGLVCF